MSGCAIFSPSVILAFTASIGYLQDQGAVEAAAHSVLFTLLKTSSFSFWFVWSWLCDVLLLYVFLMQLLSLYVKCASSLLREDNAFFLCVLLLLLLLIPSTFLHPRKSSGLVWPTELEKNRLAPRTYATPETTAVVKPACSVSNKRIRVLHDKWNINLLRVFLFLFPRVDLIPLDIYWQLDLLWWNRVKSRRRFKLLIRNELRHCCPWPWGSVAILLNYWYTSCINTVPALQLHTGCYYPSG